MEIAIIVAAAENNVIGKDNKMLWKLSADMKFFKEKTTGNAIIMGRKTFESLGRPLPSRLNIIITRDPSFTAEGCEIVNSIEQALLIAEQAGKQKAFIIGGGEIYKQCWHKADVLYLTRVHAELEGDTVIPSADDEYWVEKECAFHKADEKNEYDYSFMKYTKK